MAPAVAGSPAGRIDAVDGTVRLAQSFVLEHQRDAVWQLMSDPQSVARAIFDGMERGEEEIFPDPLSASMAESWRSGAAKALERQNAALLGAAPIMS